MTHEAAVALIRRGVGAGEAWAELGAGGGTFTRALGELVGAGGVVRASDRDAAAVRALRGLTLPGGATLHVARFDFTRPDLTLAPGDAAPLDGILMANALHFARDQEALLRRLVGQLPPGGRLLLVEYDRSRANRWVPHPVPLRRFNELASAVGLGAPEEIGRRPSRWQGQMYAAVARRSGTRRGAEEREAARGGGPGDS